LGLLLLHGNSIWVAKVVPSCPPITIANVEEFNMKTHIGILV